MKYTVNAYLCTNFSYLIDSLETDNFYEVQDFIWENCQNGYNCELIDNETGESNLAYADDFTDETIDYADLFQCKEEM